MNIISTSLLAGAFLVLPSLPSIRFADLVPASPFETLSVSAAGVGFEINAEGVETRSVASTDLAIKLSLTSGAPIRIHL